MNRVPAVEVSEEDRQHISLVQSIKSIKCSGRFLGGGTSNLLSREWFTGVIPRAQLCTLQVRSNCSLWTRELRHELLKQSGFQFAHRREVRHCARLLFVESIN